MRQLERKRHEPAEREPADYRPLDPPHVHQTRYVRNRKRLRVLGRIIGAFRFRVAPHIPRYEAVAGVV